MCGLCGLCPSEGHKLSALTKQTKNINIDFSNSRKYVCVRRLDKYIFFAKRHNSFIGTGKRGHIVAETLLLMTFPCARKLGNICCRHKMFLNKIRNIFVSRTQNLCPQQMLRARANGETFVSATMCPQQCVLVCQYLMSRTAIMLKFQMRGSRFQAKLENCHHKYQFLCLDEEMLGGSLKDIMTSRENALLTPVMLASLILEFWRGKRQMIPRSQ